MRGSHWLIFYLGLQWRPELCAELLWCLGSVLSGRPSLACLHVQPTNTHVGKEKKQMTYPHSYTSRMHRSLWNLNVKVHIGDPGLRGGSGAVARAVGLRSSLVYFGNIRLLGRAWVTRPLQVKTQFSLPPTKGKRKI